MDSKAATIMESKATRTTALKAVAERGAKVATDVIALEYQSLVGDFAFSVADRTAFVVTVLNQLDDYTNTNLVSGKSVISFAGQAVIRTHASECSKSFSSLQDAANSLKKAYRNAEKDHHGKFDQWTSRGLDWPLVKDKFHLTTETLESPTRMLLLVLHVVKLAYARMVSEKYTPSAMIIDVQQLKMIRSWDDNTTRYQDDLQRAVVALRKNPRLADLDEYKIPKTVHEPTRLDDIAEEDDEDHEKAEQSTAASEKTRVEQMRPQMRGKNRKIVIENRREKFTELKDDTAVSVRSRRSRDTESIIVLRKQSLFYRIRRFLPFLHHLTSPEQIIIDARHGPLELYMQKPFLTHLKDGFKVRWGTCKQNVPDHEIERQLQYDQKKAKLPVTEQLAQLTADEHDRLQTWRINLPFKATILSLWRETITLNAHGVIVKDVPTFRIIVSVKRHAYIQPIPRNQFESTAGQAHFGIHPPVEGPPPGPRPTYIKVHREHVEPTTLNVYNLPWEWDHTSAQEGVCQYMIIKTWIPEHDQDVLFEHTRKLREMGLVAPGSQGISPLMEDRREREKITEERREMDRDEDFGGEGGKRRTDGSFERDFRDRDTDRMKAENQLVDRLLREYTIWNGEGKEGGTKMESTEGGKEEEKEEEYVNANKAGSSKANDISIHDIISANFTRRDAVQLWKDYTQMCEEGVREDDPEFMRANQLLIAIKQFQLIRMTRQEQQQQQQQQLQEQATLEKPAPEDAAAECI